MTLLALFLIGLGIVLIVLEYTTFRVPLGKFALPHPLDPQGKTHFTSGFNFGLIPPNHHLISDAKRYIEVKDFVLETPDKGRVNLDITLTYSPNTETREHINAYIKSRDEIQSILPARMRSAVNSWIHGKGKIHPETSRRAIGFKDAGERFVLDRLRSLSKYETELNEELGVVAYDQSTTKKKGSEVVDLGIRIHEVHFTDMREIVAGTGKAIWGDETIDSKVENTIDNMRQNVKGLQQFRDAVSKLAEEHPDQQDLLEDLLNQHELSLKEFKNE